MVHYFADFRTKHKQNTSVYTYFVWSEIWCQFLQFGLKGEPKITTSDLG